MKIINRVIVLFFFVFLSNCDYLNDKAANNLLQQNSNVLIRYLSLNSLENTSDISMASYSIISNDNKNLYCTSENKNSIVSYNINQSNGLLTFNRKDSSSDIISPRAIATTYDDKNIYISSPAVSSGIGSIVCFSRDIDTGILTYESGASSSNLYNASYIAVSPDDKNVYVACGNSNKLLCYSRNLLDGTLTYRSMFDSIYISGAYSIAISPDNKYLYVTASNVCGVIWFKRDLITGDLSYIDGYYSLKNLICPLSITISPNGENVYVVSGNGDNAGSVNWFIRNPSTGELYYQDRFADRDINGARFVALSNDGANLFVTTGTCNKLLWFKRDISTGNLEHIYTFYQPDMVQDLRTISISKNGKHMYISSYINNALAFFIKNE